MDDTSRDHRLRAIANWVNLTTPLGFAIAWAGRARPRRGPCGLWVAEGYRLGFPAAGAFTIGSVVIVPRGTMSSLLRRNPRLLEHEAAHARQWAICAGLAFLPLYAAATAWSRWRTGTAYAANLFEVGADLAAGGYPAPQTNHLIPPGAEERFVGLPCGRVRVLVGGTGNRNTPVVLIHGGGTDNAGISWFRSFSALGADRKVIAIDLPGFGGTREIPPLGGPGPMADFVVRVAEELAISKAVVAGVSMGGDVALNVARRHPDFAAALILIGPGGLADSVGGRPTHFVSWLGAQLPDWALLPLARLANQFAGTVLKAIVNDPATLPAEVVDEFVREARASKAGLGYARYNQATLGRSRLTNNLLPVVHEISAPTLFFHGQDDPIVDPAGSRRAAGLMPNAQLLIVPQTGHWAQLEAHELFIESARAFLRDVDVSGSKAGTQNGCADAAPAADGAA